MNRKRSKLEILNDSQVEGGSEVSRILMNPCFSNQALQDLDSILRPFLNKVNLSAFEFARVYNDHSAVILYSQPTIAKHIVTNQVHVTAHVPQSMVSRRFWYLPSKDGPYSRLIRDIGEIAGLRGFVDYIVRSPGYFDMFCFWSRSDQDSANNQFLNLKEKIETFSLEFLDRAKEMVSRLVKNPFTLPEAMQPNFKGLAKNELVTPDEIDTRFKLFQQELIHFGMNSGLNLTERELECLPHMIFGKSSHEIAQILHISHRTVEHRIESLKNKLGCNKKSEIFNALIKLGIR